MADEPKGDELTPQETPPAETSESNPTESQAQVQEGKEEQVDATSESQKEEETSQGESGDQPEQQEAKPSRVERRINQLLSKLKETGETQSKPLPKDEEPYFTQEEIEEGKVDPDRLVQRIQHTVQSEVQKAIQMDRLNQQYESAVKEHQSDLEGIKDIDPDLEAEAVAEYEALNYQVNPYTGEKTFVPAVKLSEIVTKIQTRAQKLAEKLAEDIAEGNKAYLKNVSSSQAVPSSAAVTGKKSIKPETTDFSEFEKAYSS
jgi:hypothetical protein